MHTYESHSIRFHFNSDFSGDVLIVSPTENVNIPGKAILDFVIEKHMKPTLIAGIEKAIKGEIR